MLALSTAQTCAWLAVRVCTPAIRSRDTALGYKPTQMALYEQPPHLCCMQVRHLLGRQPIREFGPLRRVVKVQDGCDYSFSPPVEPAADSKVRQYEAVQALAQIQSQGVGWQMADLLVSADGCRMPVLLEEARICEQCRQVSMYSCGSTPLASVIPGIQHISLEDGPRACLP